MTMLTVSTQCLYRDVQCILHTSRNVERITMPSELNCVHQVLFLLIYLYSGRLEQLEATKSIVYVQVATLHQRICSDVCIFCVSSETTHTCQCQFTVLQSSLCMTGISFAMFTYMVDRMWEYNIIIELHRQL